MEEKIVQHETTSKDRTGQILTFAAAVTEQLPRDMTVEDRQYWQGHKNELKNVLAVLSRSATIFDSRASHDQNSGVTLSQEFVIPEQKREAWKIVKLGTHKNAKALREVILKRGHRITPYGDILLSRVAVSPTEIEVKLVRVRVGDMKPEFLDAGGATRDKIYSWALNEAKFNLCQTETAPQLRLQCEDQPFGGWDVVASEPIPYEHGQLGLLTVGHFGKGLELGCDAANPDRFWSADRVFIFVLRE